MNQVRDAVARGAVVMAAALGVLAVALAVAVRPRPLELGLALVSLGFVAVPLVGAAAVRGRTGGVVGWILLASGVSLPLAVCGYVWAMATFDPRRAEPLPGGTLAGWLDGWPWVFAVVLVPTVGLQLLPDGRPVSRRWRPLLWFSCGYAALLLLGLVFQPTLLDVPDVANPTALPGTAGQVAGGLVALLALMTPLTALSALSLRARRRAAGDTPIGRALGLVVPASWLVPLSWLFCIVAIGATGNSVYALPGEAAGMLAMAATAWVAVRRYGLLDVRTVVSRTLAWVLLSAAVAAVYLGLAAALGTVLARRGAGVLAVVAAVLVALPLRDVVQRAVNRLVLGYRDDPAEALDRLGQRLAGAADTHVLEAAATTTREVLRLGSVTVELDGGPTIRSGPEPLSRSELLIEPLVFAGTTIGRLVVDPGADRALTPAERRLLATIAGNLAAAGHAVTLAEALKASRERIVTATEDERRRLRRDLHDGLGPALAGVVLGLHRARGRVADAPDAATAQLDQLTAQVQEAVADVRRLVYGLRPPALDELGLVGALDEQARAFGGTRVSGDAGDDLPAAVEVAAYRIALEAMTNAAKHARAERCEVRVRRDGRTLHIEIEDDGVGLADDRRAGVGLASMDERAAELGGTCSVESLQPNGTRVLAVLPVGAP